MQTGNPAVPQANPPAAHEPAPLRLSWRHPSGLLSLSIVNYLLRILTLGVYHFWGKTEVRKRIWSAIRLDGEPLEYTGTGNELFKGFILVFAIILMPAMLIPVVLMLALTPESIIPDVYQAAATVGFFFLTGVGVFRAVRYRLARTRWRGIRGGLDDHSWSYGWFYLWTATLMPLTLFWIVPWRATELQRRQTGNMRFGSQPLRFDAKAGPLYASFAVLWLATLVPVMASLPKLWAIGKQIAAAADKEEPDPSDIALFIGGIPSVLAALVVAYLVYVIASAWYRSRQINHFAAHTHVQGATFKADTTARGLIWLAISNFMIVAAGLLAIAVVLGLVGGGVLKLLGVLGTSINADIDQPGVAQYLVSAVPTLLMLFLATGIVLFSPITQARSARYLVEHLAIDGPVDLAAIAQGADSGLTTGEGLAQAFDIDAF